MNRGISLLLALPFLLAACARTGLSLRDEEGEAGAGGAPPVPCELDSDCTSDDLCTLAYCPPQMGDAGPRACATRPVQCDDGDVCSNDRCDPTNGACSHDRASDHDGDGFLGPAPEGVPTTCGGQDCNDENPRVAPTAPEQCDGIDNDCDGAIDEDVLYAPPSVPVRLAPNAERSDVSGFAFDGSAYGVTYTRLLAQFHTESYFERVDRFGSAMAGPVLVSEINADTYAGSLAFGGQSFLTTWADARQAGNYEIYSTRFDQNANKLEPDRRLTNADYFSLRPVVRFTGTEYVVVWSDQRFSNFGGGGAIYGRRLSTNGEAAADEVRLTDEGEDADFASFDAGNGRLGVAYIVAGSVGPDEVEGPTSVLFRTFNLGLGDPSPPVVLGVGGQEPSVLRVGAYFVVVWHTGSQSENWGGALQAATLDMSGTLLAQGPVTFGDTHAKHRSLVSLGDKWMLVWAATPNDAEPYQLFYETLSAPALTQLTPRQLLVKSAAGWDLQDPHALLGPNGDVGVAYNEAGAIQAWFVRLSCQQ